MLSERSQTQKFTYYGFNTYDILEKTDALEQKTNQWLLGAEVGRGVDYKGAIH
jgi:hypothetical protein